MARITLVPQRKEFFVLLSRAGRNAVAIADLLVAMLSTFPEGTAERIREIKELEHEGDRLTREVVSLLNKTFVTPFDREDIFGLSSALDDICDHLDEAAGDIANYGVSRVREGATRQADLIRRAAGKLADAVDQLQGFKDSSRSLIELRELEHEGDEVNRGAIADLFASGDDAISVIRWKDIHGRLEDALDACENAADVLEAITLKNR
jgi:predicted phosphate transport protein (TIGR00153 family)